MQSFTRSNLHKKLGIIVNRQKRAVHMSILTYFHPVKQKPHLSSPLKEKFPPATIALEQQRQGC